MRLLQKILSHGLLIAFLCAAFFLYIYRVDLFPQWFGGETQSMARSSAGAQTAVPPVPPQAGEGEVPPAAETQSPVADIPPQPGVSPPVAESPPVAAPASLAQPAPDAEGATLAELPAVPETASASAEAAPTMELAPVGDAETVAQLPPVAEVEPPVAEPALPAELPPVAGPDTAAELPPVAEVEAPVAEPAAPAELPPVAEVEPPVAKPGEFVELPPAAGTDTTADTPVADAAVEEAAPASDTQPSEETTQAEPLPAPSERAELEQDEPAAPADSAVSESSQWPAAPGRGESQQEAEARWAAPSPGRLPSPEFRPMQQPQDTQADAAPVFGAAPPQQPAALTGPQPGTAAPGPQFRPEQQRGRVPSEQLWGQQQGGQSPAIAPHPAQVGGVGGAPATQAPPSDYQHKLAVARGHFWKRDTGAAVQAYESLTADYPDSAEAWGELGNVNFKLGHWAKASDAYYRAVSLLIEQGDSTRAGHLLRVLHGLDADKASELEGRMRKTGD
jgi:hypothetical protein